MPEEGGTILKRISIVIPMYNVVSVLNRPLESIASQDLPRDEVEIVIVDDGSTDGTGVEAHRLLEEHGLDAVFVTRQNGGVSCARNSGIEASSGDYLFFLDADDELPVDFLLHVRREVFGRGPDLVWLWKIQKKRERAARARHPMGGFTGGRDCLISYLHDPRNAQVIVRRDFLDSHGIRYRDGIAYGEDVDFFIRLLFHADRVHVSRGIVYKSFCHGGQVTRTIDPIRAKACMMTLYEGLLAGLAGNGADPELLELLRLRKAEIVIKLLMMYRRRNDLQAFRALMQGRDTSELLRKTLRRGFSIKWKMRALRFLGMKSFLPCRGERVDVRD